MDHKVSKDMISSGMIPSGEKTQADLGRTQYGSSPSPSKLMDAYKSMYDKKDEVINEHHKKDADGNTIPHEDEELQEVKSPLAPIAAKVGSAIGKNLKKRATDNKGLSSLWHKGDSPKGDSPKADKPSPEIKPDAPTPNVVALGTPPCCQTSELLASAALLFNTKYGNQFPVPRCEDPTYQSLFVSIFLLMINLGVCERPCDIVLILFVPSH